MAKPKMNTHSATAAELNKAEQESEKPGTAPYGVRAPSSRRPLHAAEIIMLACVPSALFLCARYEVGAPALLTALVAISSFVPFFVDFEKSRPSPAEIMPVVVLSAAATVGRVILAPIPNFQPVSALVIFTGIYFGRRSGYLTGAFTALISNMILGQGMWTPWQMYAWGAMGFVAGALAEKGLLRPDKKRGVYIYGIVASFLYGLLLDSWFITGFVSDINAASVAAAYGAGLIMNISHVSSTVIFLALTLKPLGKKIERVKTKYGL
jgi:energy-coupling factor transport system substrate-specific component